MSQGLVQFSKSKAAEEVAVIEPITIVYRKKKVEEPPKRIQPIHFRVPTLFPYQNTKAVPWNYETTTYLGGKEICIPDTEIVNIAGAGGMTRSGRVFAPKYTPRVSPAPTIVSPKEMATPTPTPQAGTTVFATPTMANAPVLMKVIDNDKVPEAEASKGKGSMVEKEQSNDHKKSITFEESQEFLKLIKKSDFKIVEQLNQTPSKISILSLLLSSEDHHKALLKVLNTAHVMQDITVDQFDDVVANIAASRYLGFNEAELPPKGKAHNKALHISVTCTDSLLSRVLVDTGSSINVLPKYTLSQLQFRGPEMRTSALIVRAFDGSRRQVIGEVDLPICVGPHQFDITFQVMDINPTYSCLLGQPWIHSAGAVTSTLHQKLKYLIDDKLVIVCGEEDLLVSELSSFRYVETDEGIVEVLLHCLEFEDVSSASANNNQSSATILSSAKSSKQTLEKGPLPGWGKVVNVAEKSNRFGIGYHPATRKVSQKKKQFNPVKFNSVGYQSEHTMAVIGESSGNKPGAPNLVRRCPPGFKLSSWTSTVIPMVYSEKT
ncbi:uncharacterized protein LOC127137414 [Lathyrus oleraceus]|uniref:uncharacterized protein LOC127137414 n=1 Tax=Pisum sativum TaxID=3888 RepID=UPI0021D03DF4|nr:uncharacterized protein LOC127137414 [Pisum sativum]